MCNKVLIASNGYECAHTLNQKYHVVYAMNADTVSGETIVMSYNPFKILLTFQEFILISIERVEKLLLLQ